MDRKKKYFIHFASIYRSNLMDFSIKDQISIVFLINYKVFILLNLCELKIYLDLLYSWLTRERVLINRNNKYNGRFL